MEPRGLFPDQFVQFKHIYLLWLSSVKFLWWAVGAETHQRDDGKSFLASSVLVVSSSVLPVQSAERRPSPRSGRGRGPRDVHDLCHRPPSLSFHPYPSIHVFFLFTWVSSVCVCVCVTAIISKITDISGVLRMFQPTCLVFKRWVSWHHGHVTTWHKSKGRMWTLSVCVCVCVLSVWMTERVTLARTGPRYLNLSAALETLQSPRTTRPGCKYTGLQMTKQVNR